MHYGNIKPFTIENGEGIRVSLFVSGCRNKCKNCFQPETWNFKYGNEYTKETEKTILKMLNNERISGLTILGGEPFEPENQPYILSLVKAIKQQSTKTTWIYTGCVLEKDILKGRCFVENITIEILKYIDVLVDGPFIEEQKDLSIPFRGSRNQRILKKGKDF